MIVHQSSQSLCYKKIIVKINLSTTQTKKDIQREHQKAILNTVDFKKSHTIKNTDKAYLFLEKLNLVKISAKISIKVHKNLETEANKKSEIWNF